MLDQVSQSWVSGWVGVRDVVEAHKYTPGGRSVDAHM